MSKSEVIRENERLLLAYQQARRALPRNAVIAILTCILCVGIGYLLAGGARPALPWFSRPATVFPTPNIIIRDLSALPPVASPEPSGAPLRENAAPAIVAPVSAPTMVPVAPVGIKVIVINPADGSGPIVLRDGIKYRSRP